MNENNAVRIIADFEKFQERNMDILQFIHKLEYLVADKLTKCSQGKIKEYLKKAGRIWRVSDRGWLIPTFTVDLFVVYWVESCACSGKVITVEPHAPGSLVPIQLPNIKDFRFAIDIIEDEESPKIIGERYKIHKFSDQKLIANSDEELAQNIINHYKRASK